MAKEFLSYTEQLDKLKASGLTVSNEEECLRVLSDVGYFPVVNAYQGLFRNPSTRRFIQGASFEAIHALYSFDDDLRNAALKGLLAVERRLKSVLSHEFCATHGIGQGAYLSPESYGSSREAAAIVPGLLRVLGFAANRDTAHPYLVHYRRTYSNVPLWVAMGTLTFGQCSKMYTALAETDKARVAKRLGADRRGLTQMLRVLTLFRNVCAHGERLISHRCHVNIPDMPAHKTLDVPKEGARYLRGKNDFLAMVISLQSLLPGDWYWSIEKELSKCVTSYLGSALGIGEDALYEALGLVPGWDELVDSASR